MTQTQVISDVQILTGSLGQFPDPVGKPTLIVVSGLPGTGKSYFCNKLAERLSFIILESDALRKTLFPSPTYSLPESSRLFQAIHRLVQDLLKKGMPVILDATNLSERHREHLYHIVDQLEAKLILVRVAAPPDVVYQRLKARSAGTNGDSHSDADWAVFQKMQAAAQKIRRNHYAVDTSRDITPVIDKIVREVNK
ncbi:AAA family ATPase [Chloroflexota bacterium]